VHCAALRSEYDIHPVTVYRWLRDGELRGMKIGGRTLVLLDSSPPALEPKRTDTLLDAGEAVIRPAPLAREPRRLR
jgi:hypothetical protein